MQQLSLSQLEQFSRDGFLLIRAVLDSSDCAKFDAEVLQPALQSYGGVHQRDPSTWTNSKSMSMATGEYDQTSQGPIPGAMIRKGEPGSWEDPIPDEKCLDMTPLHPILNQLHGDSTSWRWIHSNLGWIHVRFPLQQHCKHEKQWHIDGGHFSPHFMNSTEQSVIILPMIRPIGKGGGNTCVLAKSHVYITHLLHASGEHGISKDITQDCRNLAKVWPEEHIIEVEPCAAGDVLLLHPFVVHAAGFTQSNHPLRITFNMGTQWTRPVLRHGDSSWLERFIWDALQESPVEVNAPHPFALF